LSTTFELILNQQRAWATRQGLKYDINGYTLSLDDNLFCSLSPQTREEFESGKGDELGERGNRGKIQALHSSSALVINVFEYWRHHKIEAVAQACGAPSGMTEMRFEERHPTPLGGVPPHLDVEFLGPNVRPLAIESKFTELYRRKTKRQIKDKYLNYKGLWAQLPGCEKLIRRIYEEQEGKTSFSFLDAPQLLKHALGLTGKFGTNGFELLYLWYDLPSPEAEKHRQEIKDFQRYVKDEVYFRQMTYQELFSVMGRSLDADKNYLTYLGERYFSSV